jgi:hypothetical protein
MQNQKRGTEKNPPTENFGRANSAATTAPKISHPTLDSNHNFMLNGKKDRVEGLEWINVRFYPQGRQEVTYGIVKNGDEDEICLTVSEFQKLLREAEARGRKQHEETAAVGYVNKLMKRCFISVSDESIENVRRIQAGTIPKAAGTLLALSQEMFKQKGYTDQESIMNHWGNMDSSVKTKMDEWQQDVDPGAPSWTSNLSKMFSDKRKEKADREAKKVMKTLVAHVGVGSETLDGVLASIKTPVSKANSRGETKVIWSELEAQEDERKRAEALKEKSGGAKDPNKKEGFQETPPHPEEEEELTKHL